MTNLNNLLGPIHPNINIIKLELTGVNNKSDFTEYRVEMIQISHNTSNIFLNLMKSQNINNVFDSLQGSK